ALLRRNQLDEEKSLRLAFGDRVQRGQRAAPWNSECQHLLEAAGVRRIGLQECAKDEAPCGVEDGHHVAGLVGRDEIEDVANVALHLAIADALAPVPPDRRELHRIHAGGVVSEMAAHDVVERLGLLGDAEDGGDGRAGDERAGYIDDLADELLLLRRIEERRQRRRENRKSASAVMQLAGGKAGDENDRLSRHTLTPSRLLPV